MIDRNLGLAIGLILFGCGGGPVAGQMVGVTTPLHSVNDSFYERQGVGFAFQFAGPQSAFFGGLNQGSFNSAIPPFGGYDPAADARFGFAALGDNGWFSLQFAMGKGSTRTMTGIAPSVVVPNGGMGTIFAGELSPFVTGVTPVVGQPVPDYGDAPYASGDPWGGTLGGLGSRGSHGALDSTTGESSVSLTAPVDRGNPGSTAERSAPSLQTIRAQQVQAEKAQTAEIERLVAESRQFQASGDWARARNRLRSAVKKASGQLRYELQQELEELNGRR